ncbi:MAG: hypothetical protein Q9217_002579 [Psora testacea]
MYDMLDYMVWRGWRSVENIFVFGDSWSDTWFDVAGEQPSPEQPMGNPPFQGNKDAQHDRWPVHLTTAYNDSLIQTYCFARSGASVEHDIVRNEHSDFFEQVEEEFLPRYVDYEFGPQGWTSSNSLFITFFGVNDNCITADWNNSRQVHAAQNKHYSSLLDTLYTAGARNFLLMNVPPIGRAPVGNPSIASSISDWNKRLMDVAADFRKDHAGVTVHEFDTFTFFNRVMDHPASFPETAHYINVTDYCPAYAGKPVDLDSVYEECGVALKQYLWWDGLHTTSPVHEAMASQIAEQLRGHTEADKNETPLPRQQRAH